MLTARVVGAELLKVRKRWLPYILLLVLLLGAGMQVWLAGYVSWRADDAEFRVNAVRAFQLPWSFAALLDSGQFWGAILVGVLTSSMVATEYNWGTVRQSLARGLTRTEYLLAKLAGISLVAAATLLVTLLAGVWFSVLATALADEPIRWDVRGGPSLWEAPVMVLRAGYALLPYGLLAFTLTVVGRSTALGVAGTMFYVFLEAILIGVFGSLGEPGPAIAASLLGQNAAAVLSANVVDGVEYNTMSLRESIPTDQLPDPAVGALVIALYCVAFLAVSFRIFARRDIESTSGAT